MSIAEITFSVTGLSDTTMVAAFTGREALSQPFRHEITLVSTALDISADQVLNKHATLTVRSTRPAGPGGVMPPDLVVPYHGVVTHFEQRQIVSGSNAVSVAYYVAVLEPRVARLGQARNTAAFVDAAPDAPTTTVLDVVSKVFAKYAADFHFRIPQVQPGTLRKRAYRSQFQESDLDFVKRLLESEGLYFFFDHSDSSKRDELVIAYSSTSHVAGPLAQVSMPGSSVTSAAGDALAAFVCQDTLLPARVVLRDYNPERAGISGGLVTASADVHPGGTGEVVLCSEGILTADTGAEGPVLAGVRAEELHCSGRRFIGEGGVVGLRTGYTFTLQNHYRSAFNGKTYLVTDLAYEASQPVSLLAGVGGVSGPVDTSFTVTSVTAIPHGVKVPAETGRIVQFRPRRITPRPRIHGTISARVDDASPGRYAQPDDKGRYKVILPFSVYPSMAENGYQEKVPATEAQGNAPGSNVLLAGNASAWIRMAAPYGGGSALGPDNNALSQTHGMHFPLHRGAEVLLAFIEGDPDQPIIVGTVPNTANTSVVQGPEATVSRLVTAGGSAIEIDDKDKFQRISLSVPRSSDAKAGPGITRTSKGVSYMRLGSAAQDPATPVTSGFKDDENQYTMFFWTDGDAKFYTTGSFVQATGEDIDFGTTPWERQYNWQTIDNVPRANKQVAAGNTIEHSFGDNVERTIGDNVTTTVGKNIDYTFGDSETQTIGNSKEWVIGTSETYIGWDGYLAPETVTNMVRDAIGGNESPIPPKTMPKSLPDLKATMPKIGMSSWETDHGWTSWPSQLSWEPSQWTNAVKEVNWLDSVTHARGDTVERVKGNSYSETRGDAWERVNGNSDTHQIGRSDELFVGGTSSCFIGGSVDFSLAASMETQIGAALAIFVGGQIEIAVAAAIEIGVAAKLDITGGTAFKLVGGFLCKVETVEVATRVGSVTTQSINVATAGLTVVA